jgi:hypothetical protein
MGISPGHSSLIACKHTRTTFDTIFELEVNLAYIVERVAISWTNIRRALVWTGCIADICFNFDMCSGFGFALITIIDQA